MKKNFTFLLITFLFSAQALIAQLDMAFVSDFSVSSDKNSINKLTWTIANNKGVKIFYVERSINGKDFETRVALNATAKANTENYAFSDTITSNEIIMYRLIMVSKNQNVFSSKIIAVKPKMTSEDVIDILGNPAKEKLCFSYYSSVAEHTDVRIHNLNGNIVFNQKMNSVKGNNQVTISFNSYFPAGLYVLEINGGLASRTAKFIKR
jgi:outer membrane protein assembly factor BamE (lipoprotein component of BamABCDE complex)